MLFYPFGMKDGDVVDPAKLANEFQEANRVASDTCQYQFKSETITNSVIEKGSHVKVMTAQKIANLGATDSAAPNLTSTNADLFQVPYNRGLTEITGLTWPSWTATYPELVFVCFSFQSMRDTDFFNDHTQIIRTQIRLAIDGSFTPGSGPLAIPLDSLNRGTGLGAISAASSIHTMAFLPPGPHRVSAPASQMPAVQRTVLSPYSEDQVGVSEVPPNDEVAIGTRSIIVMRFARGGSLEA